MRRRHFLTAGAAFTALAVIPCDRLLAQSYGVMAARFLSSLTRFGGKVLVETGAMLLSEWLTRHPPVAHSARDGFESQFDPPVRFNAGGGRFSQPTVIHGRDMLVEELPHLLTFRQQPTQASKLNGPEMDALGDKSNPLLWRQDCGCPIRLPVAAQVRREPTRYERGAFKDLAWRSGVQDPDARLELLYVREFCRCDNLQPLMGFGYADAAAGDRGKFAVTSWA